MADDNIFDDSEDDDEYVPDVEKSSKESRREGKKADTSVFARSSSRSVVETLPTPVADPLQQFKTDAKKAKINAIWEQMNAKDSVLSARATRGPPSASKLTNGTPGWMKNLGMVPKRPAVVQSVTSTPTENGAKESAVTTEVNISEVESDPMLNAEAARKEEARKVASAALAAAKAASKALTDGKVEINEVRDFAGEEVRVTKFVDPNSKAAVAARRKAEGVASSGLDALLDQIGKKQKLNILDKSRKDWGEFKEETGIEVELEEHIKSGDKYTDKVAFLQRSDLREYEKERDARLAMLSKRRTESAPAD